MAQQIIQLQPPASLVAKVEKARWPKLTEKAISDARTKHYYIKVAPKGGKLNLSGAERMWKGGKKRAAVPDFIYLPLLRLAGRQDDIQRYLQKAVDDRLLESDLANNALLGAYTPSSLTDPSLRAQFDQELVDRSVYLETHRKPREAKEPEISLDQMLDLSKYLRKRRVKPGSVGLETGAAPVSTTAAARGGGRETISQKVQNIITHNANITDPSQLTVLDVSKFDPIKKTGARKRTPKPASAIMVPGLPIVAKPENILQYEAALRELQQANLIDEASIANALASFRNQIQVTAPMITGAAVPGTLIPSGGMTVTTGMPPQQPQIITVG